MLRCRSVRLATTLLLAALVAPAAAAEPDAPATGPEGCRPGAPLLLDGLGTPEEDLLRLAQLAGAAPLSPGVIRQGAPRAVATCEGVDRFGWAGRLPRVPAGDRWAVAVPARLTLAVNGRYPAGGNDGLLWAGRGVSTLASAGLAARWGALSLALVPEVAWQQNAWFETVPVTRPGGQPFENPWYGPDLDLPQRPATGPFARAAPGQSELRLTGLGTALGLSTANVWLGPGLRNALVLTNEGPGVPHLFVGTEAPVDFGIGPLEALVLWGPVARSRGFPARGQRWLSALALDWQPRWVPGLTVGLGRAFLESAGSLRRHGFLSALQPPIKDWVPGGDNPEDNQVASLWLRWAFPEVGLELYGEWGRDDFPISFEGLAREPERTQAWVAGLQKVFGAGPRRVRLHVEACRFHEARPLGARAGLPVWYVHPNDLGWTHDGQLLGAGVGPGGDAQRLAVDVLSPSGRLGAFLERTRRNEEVYWAVIEPLGESHDHDVELAVGLRQVLFLGRVEVAWELTAAHRWDRDFTGNERDVRGLVRLAMPLAPPPR
jgi:capsule assembly protein Wzi